MSKALTAGNRKFQGDIDVRAGQLIDFEQSKHFPSYFGNFGIFKRLLMLCAQTSLTKRRCVAKQGFPLITAFMAIV
jgi:hypothetical protein